MHLPSTSTAPDASAPSIAAPRPEHRVVWFTIGASVATVILSAGPAIQDGMRPHAFEYLFRTHEPLAALVSAVVALAALAAARFVDDPGRLLKALARTPHFFIGALTVVCAAAAVFVYRAHPLSMDEYAPLFQARAFAAGVLTGKVPPDLVHRLIPSAHWFLDASSDGRIVSVYWPGFALLLTPFTLLGVPWLLNPLLAGASLYLLWWLARRTCSSEDAAGWALLLAAASPAFTVTAISYYSMGAHLCASLAYAALLVSPTRARLLAAGAVGSLALALHNPLPHALFALPFLVFVGARRRGLRDLGLLALGYLPGTLLLGIGWIAVRCDAGACAAGGSTGNLMHELSRFVFKLPDGDLLWARAAALAKLALWAVPGLLLVAWWGAREQREHRWWRALSAAALLTLIAYLFVPYDQGHGWGYRYFHSVWGTLPLLGAAALAEDLPRYKSLRRCMFAACLGSAVALTGLRFAQVRTFIDTHLAQIPAPQASARFEVIFVRIDAGYYSVDLVQDDPFMRGHRWVLISRGKDEDERLLRRFFRSPRLASRTAVADVWQLD